jgi:polyisoprenoid-binding protein YceI
MTDSYPNNRRPDTSSSQHLSRWKIDPDRSEVRFSVRHVMVSTVSGRFTRFGGDLLYDHQLQQPAGVMVEIEAAATTESLRDPDDSSILLSLLSAQAEHLVTGDADLLVLRDRYPIVTPAEFAARL